MKQVVEGIWIDFNRPLEGDLPFFYADIKQLVTIGIGNLVDPIQTALGLPMRLPDGTLATKAQIAVAWHAVKNDPLCGKLGWKYAIKLPLNNLRLDPEDSEKLVLGKFRQHDHVFKNKFPDWECRPADAQLAVHSMAWALGADFFRKFPRFTRAFFSGDYAICSRECDIANEEGTVILRNARNRKLFLNAAASTDYDTLGEYPLTMKDV